MMQTDQNTKWQNCLLTIKELISQDEFVRWFKPTVVHGFDGQTLRLRVPSKDFVDHINDNYIMMLRPILFNEFGANITLKYAVPRQESGEMAPIKTFLNTTNTQNIKNPFVIPGVKRVVVDPQLNFDYTFENFIEGECNRLARTAGQKISMEPGTTAFNPLFIYGESGLGKTHLAQAIGIEVKKRFPDKYVLYVSAQKFQAQYTSAMQRKEINDFIHFYQMIDVLIVDDIQEFSGNKPGTQNTFFNIFNHLHLSKKQLVLTSDKPPVELKDIEERLLTRFKWGLSVELTTPDYETKVKIIRNKCRRLGVDIDEEIIEFLAENIKANIREIEGAISSFIANATLLGRPATISLARDILKAYVSFSRKEITPEAICEIVYTFFNVTKEDFFSKKRSREIVQARQVSMYLCKKHTNLSLKSIGEAIERDHATVVHAIKTVTNLIETDKGLRAHIEQIEKQIR